MLKLLVICVSFSIVLQEVLAKDQIICYYASWAAKRPANGHVLSTDLDPHLCTHINYAFIGLENDGRLLIIDEKVDLEQGNLENLSALKRINPELKVLISLGGASADTAVFSAIASDPQKRSTMVRSVVEFLQTYNYDGLDVDWEYPLNAESFITMLTDLRVAFDSHGYLLTAAVAAIPTDAAYDVPAMSRLLDVINVMTYDFHSSWSGYAVHHSPLYASPNEGEWQRDNLNCNSSLTHWILSGARPEQLTIGIAFYGHSHVLSDPEKYEPGALSRGPAPAGQFTANSGTLGYNELCQFHRDAPVGWESAEMVPYLHDGSLWVGFDNPRSAALKAQYAKDHNLYGAMIWSVETDDIQGLCGENDGLLKAINQVMK